MSFTEVEKIARRQKGTNWELIEAIAREADRQVIPIVGADSVTQVCEAFANAENELGVGSAKDLCIVAKFDHDSTTRQRSVWRRYGYTAVRTVARAGWSPEAAYDLLIGEHKTVRSIEAAVRPTAQGTRVPPASGDPESWDDDQWEAFDASVIAASRTVLMAFNLRQRGQYDPSVEATAQLVLLRDSDWDRGLAELEA